MATVQCIYANGAVACRFWDALPPVIALLPKGDKRCVKERARKLLANKPQ